MCNGALYIKSLATETVATHPLGALSHKGFSEFRLASDRP